MTNAPAKLREAEFFLRLLETLETKGDPLVQDFSVIDEVTFTLSAVLNAFYSVTEHLKLRENDSDSASERKHKRERKEAVIAFKKRHPIIFDSNIGLRNLTVHERHIVPSPERYVPPIGNRVDFVFSEPATQSTNLVFRAEYYVEIGGEQLHIISLCRDHYAALLKFSIIKTI